MLLDKPFQGIDRDLKVCFKIGLVWVKHLAMFVWKFILSRPNRLQLGGSRGQEHGEKILFSFLAGVTLNGVFRFVSFRFSFRSVGFCWSWWWFWWLSRW